MVEAMKLGFADRENYVADPDFFNVPTDMLLSKEYAAAQRRRIQNNKALNWPFAASPLRSSTTTLATADEEGNLLIATTSIGQLGVVATDTGIVLNNRMRMFHEDPDHPNCVAPRKRVRITLNPVMVFENGRPFLAVASPGADVQSQAQLQAIVAMIDFAKSPQLSAELPRWISTEFPNTSIPHAVGSKLQIESGFSQDLETELRLKGHRVDIGTGPGMITIIQALSGRGWIAGADPRGETYALGW
jgi:gamma-glutamyltranspeptidase/glutathione hydrolase